MGIGQITFAIGGSIVAFVMVIGMITIVADTTTPVASTMGIYGHYIIQISDSDGNIKAYVQTDNAPTVHFKDCLFDGFFGTTISGLNTCGITSGGATMQVGDGGDVLAIDDTNTGLGNYYSASGTGVATRDGGSSAAGPGETNIVWDNTASPITIVQTDLTGSNDLSCGDPDGDGAQECSLDEVGLFDDDGDMVSRAGFDDTLVNNGDTVDITLTITLT